MIEYVSLYWLYVIIFSTLHYTKANKLKLK